MLPQRQRARLALALARLLRRAAVGRRDAACDPRHQTRATAHRQSRARRAGPPHSSIAASPQHAARSEGGQAVSIARCSQRRCAPGLTEAVPPAVLKPPTAPSAKVGRLLVSLLTSRKRLGRRTAAADASVVLTPAPVTSSPPPMHCSRRFSRTCRGAGKQQAAVPRARGVRGVRGGRDRRAREVGSSGVEGKRARASAARWHRA